MDNEKRPGLWAALIGLFRRPKPEPRGFGCLTMGMRDMMQKMTKQEIEELFRLPQDKQP